MHNQVRCTLLTDFKFCWRYGKHQTRITLNRGRPVDSHTFCALNCALPAAFLVAGTVRHTWHIQFFGVATIIRVRSVIFSDSDIHQQTRLCSDRGLDAPCADIEWRGRCLGVFLERVFSR